MKQFTSIDEIKAVAEKFEAGKIIPARIIKGVDKKSRKASHYFKFYRNVYKISGINGDNILVCDFNEFSGKDHVLELTGKHNHLTFRGNPYGVGDNYFMGNYGISDDEFLADINNAVFGNKDDSQ